MKKIYLTITIILCAFINMNAQCTVSLTSNAGTDNQTVCQDNAITDITYQSSGTTVTVAGLPSGLTGVYSINVYTISGTPTVAGISNYTLTATGGCSPDATITGVITIEALPSASIIGGTTVCEGDAAPSIALGGIGTGPFTINYSINGVVQSSAQINSGNSTNVSAPTTPTGNYTYSLIDITDNTGCTNTANGSTTVTVNPLSTANMSTTTPIVCPFTDGRITFATRGEGTAPYTFYYTLDGVSNTAITSGTNTSVDVILNNAARTYSYQLTGISDANNCYQAQFATDQIVVSTISATISTSSSQICKEGDANLFLTATSGTPPYSFTYSENGVSRSVSTISSGSSVIVPVNTATLGDVVLQLLSIADANCTSAMNLADTIEVVSNTLSTTIQSSNETALNACDGYLEVNVQGVGPYTYAWSDGSFSDSIRSSLCNGNYAIAISNGACADSAFAAIATTSISSGTNPLILTATTADASTNGVCDGIAYVQVSGGTAPYSVSFAGNTTIGALDTIRGLCAGFYTVNVTDANSEATSFTFVIGEPATVYVTPVPLDSTIINTIVTSALLNCTVDYSNIDSVVINSFSFVSLDSVAVVWSIYGATTVNQTAIYPISQAGFYTFILDVFCTSRSSGSIKGIDNIYITEPVLGIFENRLDDVTMYPNPFNNSLTISVETNSSVNIFDATGKSVYTGSLNAGKNSITTSVFLSGVYLVTVTNTDGRVSERIIKK